MQMAIFLDMPENLQSAWLDRFNWMQKIIILEQVQRYGRQIKAIIADDDIGVNMKTVRMAEILKQEIGI